MVANSVWVPPRHTSTSYHQVQKQLKQSGSIVPSIESWNFCGLSSVCIHTPPMCSLTTLTIIKFQVVHIEA